MIAITDRIKRFLATYHGQFGNNFIMKLSKLNALHASYNILVKENMRGANMLLKFKLTVAILRITGPILNICIRS